MVMVVVVTDLFRLIGQDACRGEVNKGNDKGDLAQQIRKRQVRGGHAAISQRFQFFCLREDFSTGFPEFFMNSSTYSSAQVVEAILVDLV